MPAGFLDGGDSATQVAYRFARTLRVPPELANFYASILRGGAFHLDAFYRKNRDYMHAAWGIFCFLCVHVAQSERVAAYVLLSSLSLSGGKIGLAMRSRRM
jgi:hypothetical protein